MSSNEKIYRLIALFDIHAPLQHEPSIKAIEEFIPDYNPDEILYGGDAGEYESVCHWIEDKRRQIEGKRIKKDFEAVKAVMGRIDSKLSKKKPVKKTFLIGNHEDWIEQYIDQNPAMEGFMDLDSGLDLTKKGYNIIGLNKTYKVGKLFFTHGWYTNEAHAKKTATVAGENIMYGHAHQKQIHTVVNLGSSHSATSVPCLCNLEKDFLKNKPTSWTHGFSIIEFRADGNFNAYVIDIIKGQFTFNGKTYGTKTQS